MKQTDTWQTLKTA